VKPSCVVLLWAVLEALVVGAFPVVLQLGCAGGGSLPEVGGRLVHRGLKVRIVGCMMKGIRAVEFVGQSQQGCNRVGTWVSRVSVGFSVVCCCSVVGCAQSVTHERERTGSLVHC
jgi:hypothetical protein